MPLSKLLDALEADAEREAEQITREAEARAQQILEETERAARQAEESAHRETVAPLPTVQARVAYEAQLKVQELFSDTREQLIERVLAAIVDELANLHASTRYRGVMRSLLKEAADLIDTGLIVQTRKEDEALVWELLKELGLKAKIETTLKGWGGLIAVSDDGLVRIDNTLEARLETAKPTIRQHVARQLMEISGAENA